MMNLTQFLAITCNLLKVQEKSRVHGAIAFGFASHWLKNWRKFFKPITKCTNRNHVITFNSHLKTALNHYLLNKSDQNLLSSPVDSDLSYRSSPHLLNNWSLNSRWR